MNQVAAGYVLYGSSTMLVYSTGNGVHGFTFEPSLGEFLLSHSSIRTPDRGRVYSVNESNYFKWTDGVKRYVDWLKMDDKEMTIEGTYKVEGNTFALTMKRGEEEHKQTITIKKLSATEMSTANEEGKVVELKRKK